MIKHYAALAAATLTLGYTIYTIIEAINADGTWYNPLYIEKGRNNVTFLDKLKYSVSEDSRRINIPRIATVTATIPLTTYIITRALIAGIQNW